MNMTNPYIFGAPVKTKDMFFGRDDVFAFLREHLAGTYQDNVIMLYGQRRTGKTSILYQLLNNQYLSDGYVPVLISLEGLQDFQTNAHVFVEIARKIATTLQILLPHADQFDVTNSYFRYEFLEKQVKPRLKHQKLLLMIDEYEVLEACVENPQTGVTSVLFHQLRHLMQHYDWLSFILVGSYKLEELDAKYWKEFTGTMYHTISFLDGESARDLIEKPAAKFSVKYTPEAVQRLLELSGNHPYFLQSLCRFAYANGASRKEITRDDVEMSVLPCMEAIRNGFESIWRDVKDEEKVILSTVSHLDAIYIKISDIVRQLDYLCVNWDLKKIKRLVRQVEHKEFLHETEIHQYRYYVEFFEECVRTYQPLDTLLEALHIERRKDLAEIRDPNALKAEKNLRDAEEYAQAGDGKTAEKTFHFVLETYPDYPSSWLRFGAFYESQGKWDEALELYQYRLKECPDCVELSNAIALLLKQRYRFQEALEQFRTSLEIQKENPIALANVEEIEQWLALDSEEQRLDYCLIPIADELRRLESAIEDVRCQKPSQVINQNIRQLRAKAQQLERKLSDLKEQFPSQPLHVRLS